MENNKLQIFVVGTTASGKSLISQIIIEALKEKGLDITYLGVDGPDCIQRDQELMERGLESIKKRNTTISIAEVQGLRKDLESVSIGFLSRQDVGDTETKKTDGCECDPNEVCEYCYTVKMSKGSRRSAIVDICPECNSILRDRKGGGIECSSCNY